MAKVPGKNHREGISVVQFVKRLSTDAKAEARLAQQRWPAGVCVPYCVSMNVQVGCVHETMPYRCRAKACGRPRFSTKTGTVMECSNIGYQNSLSEYLKGDCHANGIESLWSVLKRAHKGTFHASVIDVGIEIVPMKQLEAEMSSGVPYYEWDLKNVIRQGRSVPVVPLVLIGIVP